MAGKPRSRTRCGARRKRDGQPCQCPVEPGRSRCRFHGGLSTGPKTIEGRERIATAQRARWARWRAARNDEHSMTDQAIRPAGGR